MILTVKFYRMYLFLAMLDGTLFHACMSDGLAHTRVLHKVCENRSNMTEIIVLNLQDFELMAYYDL